MVGIDELDPDAATPDPRDLVNRSASAIRGDWLHLVTTAAADLADDPGDEVRDQNLDNMIRFALASGCAEAEVLDAGGSLDRITAQRARLDGTQ